MREVVSGTAGGISTAIVTTLIAISAATATIAAATTIAIAIANANTTTTAAIDRHNSAVEKLETGLWPNEPSQ